MGRSISYRNKRKIIKVENQTVSLDQTIIYAFSGGQSSDSGSINGFEILFAEKKDKEILYTLPKGHNLKIGDTVNIKIDWRKRYKIMRLHFAAELILELVYQNYNNSEKIGANVTDARDLYDVRNMIKFGLFDTVT